MHSLELESKTKVKQENIWQEKQLKRLIGERAPQQSFYGSLNTPPNTKYCLSPQHTPLAHRLKQHNSQYIHEHTSQYPPFKTLKTILSMYTPTSIDHLHKTTQEFSHFLSTTVCRKTRNKARVNISMNQKVQLPCKQTAPSESNISDFRFDIY